MGCKLRTHTISVHKSAARNVELTIGWSRLEPRVDESALKCLRLCPQQSSDRESAAAGKEEKRADTKPSHTPAR